MWMPYPDPEETALWTSRANLPVPLCTEVFELTQEGKPKARQPQKLDHIGFYKLKEEK